MRVSPLDRDLESSWLFHDSQFLHELKARAKGCSLFSFASITHEVNYLTAFLSEMPAYISFEVLKVSLYHAMTPSFIKCSIFLRIIAERVG